VIGVRSSGRRGLALLFTLVVFVLIVTTCASLARFSTRVTLRRALDQRTAQAEQLREEAQRAIQEWLESQSGTVSLAPDVLEPSVSILRDRWSIDGRPYRVDISAWDQCGMLPLEYVASGHSLRRSIPDALLDGIDAMPPGVRPGLDLFVSHDTPYAPHPSAEPTLFGSEPAVEDFPETSSSTSAALGAHVATHNEGAGRINVNTTPLPLLEAVCRLAGRDVIAQVREAREQGGLALIGAARHKRTDPQVRLPRIVSQSDAWAFRIDVQVGHVTKAWWAVYQLRNSDWSCVQRLSIP